MLFKLNYVKSIISLIIYAYSLSEFLAGSRYSSFKI